MTRLRARTIPSGQWQNMKPLLAAVPGKSLSPIGTSGTQAAKVRGLPQHGGRSQIGVQAQALTLFQGLLLGGQRLLYDHVHQDAIATTRVVEQEADLRVKIAVCGFRRNQVLLRSDCNSITG